MSRASLTAKLLGTSSHRFSTLEGDTGGPKAPLYLPGPYTQRICVNRYWPVNTLETERINHTATLKFAFYVHRKRQSAVFSLSLAPKAQKTPCKSRAQIKAGGIQRAMQWQALIGTNGIKTQADLARYLGASRARIPQVLKRLMDQS